MVKEYRGIVSRVGSDVPVRLSDLKAGESIKVVRGVITSFTIYRPPRYRDESPVQYYKRTGCVDHRYTNIHNGQYYCNPSHCGRSWRSKKTRDKHLEMAYAVLT
jgi:hypothetical protein